jgi:hypothetical protein
LAANVLGYNIVNGAGVEFHSAARCQVPGIRSRELDGYYGLSAVSSKATGDCSLRRLWRLTNTLFRVGNGALTLRDVKNEGRPGYVHENTGEDDKMSCEMTCYLQEIAASGG